MKIDKLIEANRKEELKAIYAFVNTANLSELASIIDEIRCCHHNLLAFNADTGLLAKIDKICLNGDCIQLNIEKGT